MQGALPLCATTVAGLLDTLALAAAMSFIGLLVNPDTLIRHGLLQRLRSILGDLDQIGFVVRETLTSSSAHSDRSARSRHREGCPRGRAQPKLDARYRPHEP
jgi:hypothetical protein